MSSNFKPRYDHKSNGYLPLPATVKRGMSYSFANRPWLPIVLLVLVVYLMVSSLLGPVFSMVWRSYPVPKYPPPHPYTSKHTIEKSSRFLYPPIQHAPLLQELGVDKLVEEVRIRDAAFPEIEKTLIRSLNYHDNPDPVLQSQKEEEENQVSDLTKAINSFKNQDKVVFKSKSGTSPKVVVVTIVDFDKYSVDHLTKIVQNRVDYTHKQNYGLYIRWVQELLPVLNSKSFLRSKERAKWARIYALRAAMFAFPDAEWFWFLDEDALIMDLSIDVQQYILKPESLTPIMLRDQSLVPPNGQIKTYKNSKAENIKLILVQSESKLETYSFFVKNDNIGRAIIETWGNPLYLNYPNFPFGPDSALTHMLQWHPFVLSKTALIPVRTVAAYHTDVELPPSNGKGGDHVHYYKGDFVAQWTDCKDKDCEKLVDSYYEMLQNK